MLLYVLTLCLFFLGITGPNFQDRRLLLREGISLLNVYEYPENRDGVRKCIDDDKFVKSKIDKGKYRYLKLDNGLKVYLVSKDDITNSEVAISVEVGFLHDPVEIQGLSNLVQHTLLLASKQYPDVEDFQNFVNTLNGKIYLDLHSKLTIYSFTIGTEYLNESLFRFSSYFMNPILNKDNINKALVTIFGILERMKMNEKWAMKTIEREVCEANTSFNRYIFGSKNIFLNNPNLAPGELYERVLDYFNNYYSPNIMTLSVVGMESLDKLEKYVVKSFGRIKNNGIKLFRIEDTYKFTVNPFLSISGSIVSIKRTKERKLNTFTIRIPIEFQVTHWRRIPTLYVKYLLDSSYKGVLRKFLTGLGVPSEIKVTTMSFDGFSTLDITISLSNRELRHSWQVIRAIVSALRFIAESPVTERLLNEMRDVTSLLFNYRESEFYKDIAYNIVYKSQKYKIRPEEVIYADELIQVLDAEFIGSFLNSIDLNHVIIFYLSPTLLKEKKEGSEKVVTTRKYFSFRSNMIKVGDESEAPSSLPTLFLKIFSVVREYILLLYSLIYKELKFEEKEAMDSYSNDDYMEDMGAINHTNHFVLCNSILKSRYLNSEYCVNEIPVSFIDEIRNMTLYEIKEMYMLDINTPNKYIPKDLSLQQLDEKTEIIPQPLLFSIKRYLKKQLSTEEKRHVTDRNEKYYYFPEILNFYYKNSVSQTIPEASLSIRIQTPVITTEFSEDAIPKVLKIVPRLMVSLDILSSALLLSLKDEVYDFGLTKNKMRIVNHNSYFYNSLPNGFTLILYGYQDVIPTFLKVFADHLKDPVKYITHLDFAESHTQILKMLHKTVYRSTSLTKSLEIIKSLTENQQLSPIERLREIENVSYTDIIELSKFLAKYGQIEGIFMNNLTPVSAGKILNDFIISLGRKPPDKNKGYGMIELDILENGKVVINNKEELVNKLRHNNKLYSVHNMLVPISKSGKFYFNSYEILDITSLPYGLWRSYRFEYSNNDDDRSVVSLLLVVGTKTPFTIALTTLSNILLSNLMSVFLKKLNIENETARTFSPAHYSSLIFSIIQIDSYSKDIIYLTEFLIGFLEEVFNNPYLIDKNDFYILKRDCINKFRNLNNDVHLFNDIFFTFIEGSSYPFIWVEKVIQIFETLSFARFLKLFKLLYKTPRIIVSVQSKVSHKYKIDRYIPSGYTLLNSTDDLLNQDNLYIYKLPINVSPNIFPQD